MPKYAVIPVGKYNQHGHHDGAALSRFRGDETIGRYICKLFINFPQILLTYRPKVLL